jgi:hypothetical protein
MKKLLVFLGVAAMVIGTGVSSATAEDTRQFQYSPKDKSTPVGISPYFDLTELQLGLTVDDDFEIFAALKSTPADSVYQEPGALAKLEIDTNLDGISDYSIDSTGEYDRNYTKPRTLILATGAPVLECDSSGWITPGFIAWRIAKSCFTKLASTIGLRISATKDGVITDFLPDGGGWFKPKTGYLAAATCSASSYANKKLTYNNITYICSKTSNKWSWKDYGPIAAKNAKYPTEKAYYACNIRGKIGVELGDGGKTLTVEAFKKYELSMYVSESQFNCLKSYLSVPSWVSTMIGQTRALDGMVKASWGRINAFWNYHPDSGLGITFNYR